MILLRKRSTSKKDVSRLGGTISDISKALRPKRNEEIQDVGLNDINQAQTARGPSKITFPLNDDPLIPL